jgi:predicted aspartyl protease
MKRTLFAIACACALLPLSVLHAAEAPRCLYVEVAKLPIRYVGQGLAPAVDGTIDNTPATMLVDTGAFATQLTMNGVTKRGLGLQMTGDLAQGVGGWSRLYAARVQEISLGPTKTHRSSQLRVIGDANLTPAFDAIIGAPFLLQADLEVDLGAKQIRFFRSRDCGNTDLAIWKEETIVVPFAVSSDRSPNPHFTVKVDGKELDAIIDTGAHHTTMTAYAAKRIGIDLKGPGVKPAGYIVGVGSERAPQLTATFKSIEVGNEAVRDAEIGILDAQGEIGADILIGQDFLRAHRVLFAMSQKKLYIAYTGGTPFSRSAGLEPWMRAEAEAGNPDAQYTVAAMYGTGRGVARDPVQAEAWLHKAAAGGEPHASLTLGRRELVAGHAAAAIPLLRAGLAQLPADRVGPLWLYTARVRNGEPALATTELQASLKQQQDDGWPRPVADFYLGKLDATGLLDAAAKDQKLSHARSCQANVYMAEWHGARGETAQADALMASVRAHCAAPAPAARDAAS